VYAEALRAADPNAVVETLVAEPLPLVGLGSPVADLRAALETAGAALVTDHGRPVAVAGPDSLAASASRPTEGSRS
jgi:hypothetical protein